MAQRLYQADVSIDEICDDMEKDFEKVLEKVAVIVCDKLKEYIKVDFYQKYQPILYRRSLQFMRSPKWKLNNSTEAEVFIDTDVMHYLGISAEDMLDLAEQGFHGTKDIFREGYFWEDFLSWCNDNIDNLMIYELKKYGYEIS